MHSIARRLLTTDRLSLRPSSRADASRAFEIRSDWEVARMLSMATYPPDPSEMAAWFASHEHEWQAGRAYRFAIESKGQMVGLVDLDAVESGHATLGYWLARSAWGQGFAFEAAQAVLRFGFNDLMLERVGAGHAADNQASERILTKLGFRLTSKGTRYSRSRAAEIEQWRYELARDP